MEKREAIQKLRESKTITTEILDPLGISFESFLSFAQKDKETRKEIIENLIKYFEEGE